MRRLAEIFLLFVLQLAPGIFSHWLGHLHAWCSTKNTTFDRTLSVKFEFLGFPTSPSFQTLHIVNNWKTELEILFSNCLVLRKKSTNLDKFLLQKRTRLVKELVFSLFCSNLCKCRNSRGSNLISSINLLSKTKNIMFCNCKKLNYRSSSECFL